MVAKFVIFLAFLALAQAGLVRRGAPDQEYVDLIRQQVERHILELEKNLDDLQAAKRRDQALAIFQKLTTDMAAAQAEASLKLRELATKQ